MFRFYLGELHLTKRQTIGKVTNHAVASVGVPTGQNRALQSLVYRLYVDS
jgi:hypothetical protein